MNNIIIEFIEIRDGMMIFEAYRQLTKYYDAEQDEKAARFREEHGMPPLDQDPDIIREDSSYNDGDNED